MEIFKLNQWVVWKYDGEQKVPVRLGTGKKASVTDPSHWSPFEEVEEVWSDYWGIGFVFTMDDPYCGIDLDDCIDPDTGVVAPWAAEIIETLDSYSEISPSGRGTKVWVKATKPGPRCKQGNFEMYDSEHYFTFTGRQCGECTTIESRQHEVGELYHRFFPERTPKVSTNTGEGFKGDDDELYEKMRNKGADWWAFRKLYEEGEWASWG